MIQKINSKNFLDKNTDYCDHQDGKERKGKLHIEQSPFRSNVLCRGHIPLELKTNAKWGNDAQKNNAIDDECVCTIKGYAEILN